MFESCSCSLNWAVFDYSLVIFTDPRESLIDVIFKCLSQFVTFGGCLLFLYATFLYSFHSVHFTLYRLWRLSCLPPPATTTMSSTLTTITSSGLA